MAAGTARPDLDTEADGYAFLERLRWGDAGPTSCPHCGSSKGAWFLTPRDPAGRKSKGGTDHHSDRRVWKCKETACRRQFSVLTNSALHGTKLPVRTLVGVVFDLAESEVGLSARELAERFSMTERSAQRLLQRLHAVLDPVAVSRGERLNTRPALVQIDPQQEPTEVVPGSSPSRDALATPALVLPPVVSPALVLPPVVSPALVLPPVVSPAPVLPPVVSPALVLPPVVSPAPEPPATPKIDLVRARLMAELAGRPLGEPGGTSQTLSPTPVAPARPTSRSEEKRLRKEAKRRRRKELRRQRLDSEQAAAASTEAHEIGADRAPEPAPPQPREQSLVWAWLSEPASGDPTWNPVSPDQGHLLGPPSGTGSAEVAPPTDHPAPTEPVVDPDRQLSLFEGDRAAESEES